MERPSLQPTFGAGWLGLSGHTIQTKGISSLLTTILSHSYLFDSAKLLILGSVIETGRRSFKWLAERFRFQYLTTAQFDEGDPAYEWIILFLTQENIWRRSHDFRVSARTSTRKRGIRTGNNPQARDEGNANYVPTYEVPQLFRWKGYWVEVKREREKSAMSQPIRHVGHSGAIIYLTIYTLDTSVLSTLVEEARRCYIEDTRPNVSFILRTWYVHNINFPRVSHLLTQFGKPIHGPSFTWTGVKRKDRRPLNSVILKDGALQSLVQDAKEFIASEDWYMEVGIPHRRGYLLYGPPGTGKSSTIYALAGELGFEIYALSLASRFVDDSYLQRAASSVPKHGILLIEDIDCAFPSRDDDEDELVVTMPGMFPRQQMARRPPVTLSGLLNMIDGVGSEEGKLFFATTNYVDQLDLALLRPGRIDRKIQYSLATKNQASSTFTRLFPESRFSAPISVPVDEQSTTEPKPSGKEPNLLVLAETFAASRCYYFKYHTD